MTRKTLARFILSAALVVLGACAPQEPITVFVTPTPAPTDAPTLAAVTSTLTFTPVPTATTAATEAAVVPSTTPEPTTAVPVATLTPDSTPSFIGPIIGPDYTPPTNPPPSPPPPTSTTEPGAPTPTPAPETQPAPPTSPPGQLAALPNLDGGFLGVQLDINLSDEDWNEAMARIEQLGVRWVKVQLPWRDMQPNGPDERDTEFFRRIEQHLEDANNRGFNMLVSVVKAPAWSRSNQTEDGPPDDPAALARFITLIFNEFNAGMNREMVGEYIDAIEIWNEPNLIREWQGTLPFNGGGYMRLFAPAYNAVRAYSPTVPIVVAGLAPTGNSPGSVDDTEFLRQMYAAGLGRYRDVVIGVHPYGWGNPPDSRCCGSAGWDDNPHFFYLETLDAYRTIMRENGHGDVPMWITEFGYASWDGMPLEAPQQWMTFNDRWEQGGYTVRAIQIAQERGDIQVKILWNLNFGVLSGLISGRDERAAYSMLVPGDGCAVNLESTNVTERPIFWMLFDAVRPDVQLQDFCGIPPNPIPGLG